jgi:hypothetical protein
MICAHVKGAADVCCPHPIGHLDYCKDCGPCDLGQGDCDNDSECARGLICPQVKGVDICSGRIWPGDVSAGSLAELMPLFGYTSVKGNVNLYVVSEGFENLEGLESLIHIGGSLVIGGDYSPLPQACACLPVSIKSLKGLKNLVSIDGSLVIDCTSLNELGLDSLSRISGDLIIDCNGSLPLKLSEELRDQVLSRGGIGGIIRIE